MKLMKLKEYLKGKTLIDCPNCNEALILDKEKLAFPIASKPKQRRIIHKRKSFTTREKQIITGMHNSGYSTLQIARRLSRPPSSIHGYIRKISKNTLPLGENYEEKS